MKKTLLTLSILAALGTLTACGGGGSASSGTAKTVTGVISAKSTAAKARLAAGATAGGSTITVNGTTYTLDGSTSIDADDSPGDETDLNEGDVVTIVGTDNGDGTGTAVAVEFDDETQGYVLATAVTADATAASGFTGTINVMGKDVQITADTVYSQGDSAKATIGLLAAADVVEVSGFPDANGNIIATRIEGKNPSEDIEVKGVISNVTATTFTLGTLIVDFSAADVSDLPGGLPAAGLFVEVKAAENILSLTDNGDGTYTLTATKVELEDEGDLDEDSASDGDDMEVTGVLVVDGSVMTLNGYTLVVSSNSSITEGQLAALAGQLVEVEGYIDNGSLVVTEAKTHH